MSYIRYRIMHAIIPTKLLKVQLFEKNPIRSVFRNERKDTSVKCPLYIPALKRLPLIVYMTYLLRKYNNNSDASYNTSLPFSQALLIFLRFVAQTALQPLMVLSLTKGIPFISIWHRIRAHLGLMTLHSLLLLVCFLTNVFLDTSRYSKLFVLRGSCILYKDVIVENLSKCFIKLTYVLYLDLKSIFMSCKNLSCQSRY